MKVQLFNVENLEQLEMLDELKIDCSVSTSYIDFYIRLEVIDSFCKTDDGHINIFSFGIKNTIKFDEAIWDKLVNEIENE